LDLERATHTAKVGLLSTNSDTPHSDPPDRTALIDMIAHDPKTDEAVLVMKEPEAWDGSDERLHELQERFNCYVSFLLDGEFAEWNPQLAQKRIRIEVRCAHMPDGGAVELLHKIRSQLAHQEIDVQVVVKEAL
jgi:hypothetical protein